MATDRILRSTAQSLRKPEDPSSEKLKYESAKADRNGGLCERSAASNPKRKAAARIERSKFKNVRAITPELPSAGSDSASKLSKGGEDHVRPAEPRASRSNPLH